MPAASSAGIKEIYLIKGGHVISIVGEDEFNLSRTLQNDFKLNANVTSFEYSLFYDLLQVHNNSSVTISAAYIGISNPNYRFKN